MQTVNGTISTLRADESLEAKMRWFLEKTPDERLRSALEDMAFVNAINQFELPHDRSTFTTVFELALS